MAKHITIALVVCMTAAYGSAGAQRCDPTQAETTPTSHFHLDENGHATDTRSGLEWKRCTEGQVWLAAGCRGAPESMSIADARRYLDKLNSGQKVAWRLPSHDELMTLIESRCVFPSINLRVFPATPVAAYWTDTHVDLTGYWSVDFGEGFDNMADSSQPHLLRLVRKP